MQIFKEFIGYSIYIMLMVQDEVLDLCISKTIFERETVFASKMRHGTDKRYEISSIFN